MDVKQLYLDLIKQGKTPKDAAIEAQERTGISVVTGRPINKQLGETSKAYQDSGQLFL